MSNQTITLRNGSTWIRDKDSKFGFRQVKDARDAPTETPVPVLTWSSVQDYPYEQEPGRPGHSRPVRFKADDRDRPKKIYYAAQGGSIIYQGPVSYWKRD